MDKKATILKIKEVLVVYLNQNKCKKGKDGKPNQDLNWTAKDITNKTNYKTDLGLDSLDLVELLMAYEDGLMGGDLYLDEKAFGKIATFGESVKEIEKYVKKVEKVRKQKAAAEKAAAKKKIVSKKAPIKKRKPRL
jgi:acyl carrier protein